MIENVHPGRWRGYGPKSLLNVSSVGENRLFIRIFGAFNQFMRQQATFSFFFIIP